MSKTPEKREFISVDFEEILDNIAEEKREKRSAEWRTYKYAGLTLLLNTKKNFIKIEETNTYINTLNELNFLLNTSINAANVRKVKKTIKDKKEDEKERVQKAVRIVKTWDKMSENEDNINFKYTKDVRSINKNILNYYLKTGWIRKKNNNLFFVINSKWGVSGLYYLNANDLKSNKKYVKNSIKGLITLNKINKNTKKVIITESPVDGLSYLQLHDLSPENTCILATGGTIGKAAEQTLQKIKKLIQQKKYNVQFVLAFDNDDVGKKFAQQTKQILAGLNVKTHFPGGAKDWNDVLQKKVSLHSPHSLFAFV